MSHDEKGSKIQIWSDGLKSKSVIRFYWSDVGSFGYYFSLIGIVNLNDKI